MRIFSKILRKYRGIKKLNKKPADPIRAELFSIERLEEHAIHLAKKHRVIRKPTKGRSILPRVKKNRQLLRSCYHNIEQSMRDKDVITPAAEWLIDNFHVIETQILEILDFLPPKFYYELPKLDNGPLKGFPRIYGLAWAFIAHTDSNFDPERLKRFVNAYQSVVPLSIGELWALSISLRIIFVENLRRLGNRIVYSKKGQMKADEISDALLGLKVKKPADPSIAYKCYSGERMPKAFAVQLLLRLRDQGERVEEVLEWLDKRLEQRDSTIEEIVRLEHQEQTAMNTTVQNIITSMRLVSSLDWAEFFEEVSVVDKVFREGSRFAEMDFLTRDTYRNAVEELARGCWISEVDIARLAVEKTRKASLKQSDLKQSSPVEYERQCDPGYYLISKGRKEFEKEIHSKPSFRLRLFRAYTAGAVPAYLGSVFLVTLAVLSFPLMLSYKLATPLWAILSFGLMALIPTSDFAISVINRIVTKTTGPRRLAKLDFNKKGIPEEYSTLVVIPTMLTQKETIVEQINQLEIHYLGNSKGYIKFALITDWADADTEKTEKDDALLKTALEGVEKLNKRYGPTSDGGARFFIFHRKRVFNEKANAWMGWERKRGKLHELNLLLLGDKSTNFIEPSPENSDTPKNITYVVTLDSDTRMSYGTAYRLVGTMAHPLNRAFFDKDSGRVTRGYGVLQPRITPTLPETQNGSLYQKAYSSAAGIDPYAFAVSDVYQDLFKEGSYIGKGIYDLDMFEASLKDRVPENSVLSHDLFEGLFARTALVTDIEFFEEFPPSYEMDAARIHRWVRGDWQLLPWIFGKIKNPKKSKAWHSLPLMHRWKMADNLRRSLSVPTFFASIVLGLTLNFPVASAWVAYMLALLSFNPLLHFAEGFLPRSKPVTIKPHLRLLASDFRAMIALIGLSLTFIAHQTWMMVDAIVRTIYRLFISHKNLLEWTTSATQAGNLKDKSLGSFYKRMNKAVVLSVLVPIPVLLWGSEEQLWIMLPITFFWVLSPWIAQQISLTRSRVFTPPATPENLVYFRKIARKTWRFFETFVDEKSNFLPPDNFQEIPKPVLAHRTSPTNIGLYLIAITNAHDFGWIGLHEATQKLEDTFQTLQSLKLYRGHLFNWYDTKTVTPLPPSYISTVDSGNLAGHLWAVSNTCKQIGLKSYDWKAGFNGFRDTVRILEETVDAIKEFRSETVTRIQLDQNINSINLIIERVPENISEYKKILDLLDTESMVLKDMTEALCHNSADVFKRDLFEWARLLCNQIKSHLMDVSNISEEENCKFNSNIQQRLMKISDDCDDFVNKMDFSFLFNPVKKIFSIGFRTDTEKLDESSYDLLASEARLASFVAIAKGDVPPEHWFHMTRSLLAVENGLALVSWAGSMFEYLMPSLVMRSPNLSLLDQTCYYVVRRHISYGKERNVPWGISESAYNVQNLEMDYQYLNFGVPDLGLKRQSSTDLLVAPYATGLAAMLHPRAAAKNFKKLTGFGASSRYGFYEALDFSPQRLPEGKKVAVVQSYMAHHQGMLLVSLANVLFDGVVRNRFHSEPRVQTGELLLQERIPRSITTARIRSPEVKSDVKKPTPFVLRRYETPHDVNPRTHLLSNGHYSVMVTTAGSGFSRWGSASVTRWREDAVRDNYGTYIFIRDVQKDHVWSAGYQPTGSEPDNYEVDFSEDRAQFLRRDRDIETKYEVVVSPEDDAEIRQVTIKNNGDEPVVIDVTSYAEMVLAPLAADMAHPAFSNLFVKTEFIPQVNGLLCTRRNRFPEDLELWAAHVVVVEGNVIGEVQYETNRAHFLGRGRGVRTPICVIDGKPLSNNVGSVLDPIVSLRRRVRIDAGKSAKVTFSTLITSSREQTLELADKYHDVTIFERTVTLAWTHAHIQHHHLNITPSEAHIYQDLASRLIYATNAIRPQKEVLESNQLGLPDLWAQGISGDFPILLVRVRETDDFSLIREILKAQEYWHTKNFAVDLVILNEREPSYSSEYQGDLEGLIHAYETMHQHKTFSSKGKIFIFRQDQLSSEQWILLRTAARVTLESGLRNLLQQLERLEVVSAYETPHFTARKKNIEAIKETPLSQSHLDFFNGLGGFSKDGKEYVTVLGAGQWTPAPWINVVSNQDFGFQASESGSGYTWFMNSRENQITPWSNDPVSDPSGEVFYIQDDDTGELWTPTLLPIREEAWPYICRHGQGYSIYEHESHDIKLELLQFVPTQDPIKISRLSITNTSNSVRNLTVSAYVEWVLGRSRIESAPFIITEMDKETGAMMARNPWNIEFSERVAFADMCGEHTSWTADRNEFIGRNGALNHPAALENRVELSGKTGAKLNPCAALQKNISLKPGAFVEVVFFLGEDKDQPSAVNLIKRWRKADISSELDAVKNEWENVLGAIQVRTPDKSMDIMLNRWLLYQTLVCRIWARCGFYQAGGAYGFRDQLQDVLAVIVQKPNIAREQILLAASRQFPEGDVQHWWHPPSGRGVRTHISDDLIWLPYVVAHYLQVTGDTQILSEEIPFLEARPIPEGKEDMYYQPSILDTKATLYEHCARALDRSLKTGKNGLPLMGTGDWNDGMNRVGCEGEGESVWLAWFLHMTLWEFSQVAETQGDCARAEKWRLHVGELKTAVERNGWDGEWYKRAYFDDGTELGTHKNKECQIDSIAQTWGVISGAADPARAMRAMDSLHKHLIKRNEGIILLLTPPFDQMEPSPGYIRSYLPGVRENGGQYSHAASWTIIASACLRDGDTAGELFSILNPINHGSSRTDINRYKIEPYVMAGDVYSNPTHLGRGGWSWYTGSSGWMYRAGVEWILGFRIREDKLFLDPCIPSTWPEYEITYKYHTATYLITVKNPNAVCSGIREAWFDEKLIRCEEGIPLSDDGSTHILSIILGKK